MQLDDLNCAGDAAFVAALGGIYEHSPWVAERVRSHRPFASLDALAVAMQTAMLAATPDQQRALICAHPELAGKAAIAGALTAHSTAEQSGAGLTACTPAQFARLHELNAAYRARFGFPFILAVKGHTRESVIAAFEARLAHAPETEFAEALRQIGRIARLRLEALLG